MSDLKLAVGKKYWTRNGQVRTVVEHDTGDTKYPWRHSGDAGDSNWCMGDGRDNTVSLHDTDLIREATTEELLTEQTIETFAKIVRNGGNVPDGMRCECLHAGVWRCKTWVNFEEGSHYRLVPIEPPKPEMVPLDAGDIPPGSVVRLAEVGWLNIAEVTDDGITVNSLAPDHISYADLKGDEWQILRPGQTWTRCEKAAT